MNRTEVWATVPKISPHWDIRSVVLPPEVPRRDGFHNAAVAVAVIAGLGAGLMFVLVATHVVTSWWLIPACTCAVLTAGAVMTVVASRRRTAAAERSRSEAVVKLIDDQSKRLREMCYRLRSVQLRSETKRADSGLALMFIIDDGVYEELSVQLSEVVFRRLGSADGPDRVLLPEACYMTLWGWRSWGGRAVVFTSDPKWFLDTTP